MHTYPIKGEKDLRALLSVHKRMPDMRLGEVLLEEELITEDQLETALETQQKYKTGTHHLGQIMVESGLVTPEQLNVALARKLGIPFVSIEESTKSIHTLLLWCHLKLPSTSRCCHWPSWMAQL